MKEKLELRKRRRNSERSKYIGEVEFSDADFESVAEKVHSKHGDGEYTFIVNYGGRGCGYENVWQGQIWKEDGTLNWNTKKNRLRQHTGLRIRG